MRFSVDFHVAGLDDLFVGLSVGIEVKTVLVVDEDHVSHPHLLGDVVCDEAVLLILVGREVASFVAVPGGWIGVIWVDVGTSPAD
jgi:hypothetical protein